MRIIKENLDDLIIKTSIKVRNIYENQQLNQFITYWKLFDEKEEDIMKLLKENLDSILYSKYYWCTEYIKLYNKIYGQDIGIEQQQFQIIEEINHRLEEVDWSIIQIIDESLEE